MGEMKLEQGRWQMALDDIFVAIRTNDCACEHQQPRHSARVRSETIIWPLSTCYFMDEGDGSICLIQTAPSGRAGSCMA